jgi:hypothetical protein
MLPIPTFKIYSDRKKKATVFKGNILFPIFLLPAERFWEKRKERHLRKATRLTCLVLWVKKE